MAKAVLKRRGRFYKMRPAIEFIKDKFGDAPLIGAEIGVAEGIHAKELYASLNFNRLYLIDIWEVYYLHREDEAIKIEIPSRGMKLVKKMFDEKSNIEIIKGDSVEVSKRFQEESLDFVYIDGNHDYEFVKKDIEAWYPKVKKGGVLCGHDFKNEETPWLGVDKAVLEFAQDKNLTLNFKNWDWWVIKV